MRGKFQQLAQRVRHAFTAASTHEAPAYSASSMHRATASVMSSLTVPPSMHSSHARSMHSSQVRSFFSFADLPHHHTCREERKRITSHMEQHHPNRQLHPIGVVAYRADSRSPEEMKKNGAFLPNNKKISIASQMDNPLNEGFVSWTLLPEVASIIAKDLSGKGHKEVYIYAQHIDKAYLMDGPWCQLAVPAIPLAETWCARKVESINEASVTVGALLSDKSSREIETTYKPHGDYLFTNFIRGKSIPLPKQEGINEDYPPEYDIRQTPITEKFRLIREAEAQQERSAPAPSKSTTTQTR